MLRQTEGFLMIATPVKATRVSLLQLMNEETITARSARYENRFQTEGTKSTITAYNSSRPRIISSDKKIFVLLRRN